MSPNKFLRHTDVDTEKNVSHYIKEAGALNVFGESVSFSQDTWDLTKARPLKSKKAIRLRFAKLLSNGCKSSGLLDEPFLSMAKAFIVHREVRRPTTSPVNLIVGWRLLEKAAEERKLSSITAIDAALLNRAAQIAKARFSAWSAYSAGKNLAEIAQVLDAERMVRAPLQWRNPISMPGSSIRIGKEFDERRASRLPSVHQLDMLALAFNSASTAREIVVTSCCALLCSAPDRMAEILTLPAACEIARVNHGGGGVVGYGLRYWPAKGGEPCIKWIVPSMADVVKLAIARIRRLTDDARRVAAWYENNPGNLYLPDELEHLRGNEALTYTEVSAIVFLDAGLGKKSTPNDLGEAWCFANKIKRCRRGRVSFREVEAHLLRLMPKNFPILDKTTNLLFSDALLVIRRNELSSTKATYRAVLDYVTVGVVSMALNSDHTIFESLGLTELDGSPIRLKTHCFRHYLETLARVGGVSEEDIARWAGRKNTSQNAAYNHVSNRDLNALISDKLDIPGGADGSLSSISGVKLIKRGMFPTLNHRCAHTTELGYCVHDFSMLPCQLNADCIHCTEHVVVKGDEVGERNIRMLLDEGRQLLATAERACGMGVVGADRWIVHQRKTVERAAQVVEIIDDPSVPIGSCIRLMGELMPLGVSRAREQRGTALGDREGADLVAKFLGGPHAGKES